MHEVSLVRSLLRQVDEIRRDHEASGITNVRIEVGLLSGVEPLLVAEAFDQLKIGTVFADTTLSIDHAPLTAACRECEVVFEVQDFRFICPSCDSTSVRVISGDQFRLINVTIECDAPATNNEEASIQ